MANTLYDQLTPFVLPEVAGCSVPMVERAIREAAIEFCNRSKVWIYVCDPVDLDAGEGRYDIDVPTQSSLVEIKSVKIANEVDPLSPVTVGYLEENYVNWQTDRGNPRQYTQLTDEEVLLVPIPNSTLTDGLIVTLCLKPSRSSTGFPAWINERYQDAIVAGAKQRLLMMSGVQWSNPMAGAMEKTVFENAIANASVDAALSRVRATIRTTPTH